MEKIINPQGVYNQAYKVKFNENRTFQSTQADYDYQTGDTEALLKYNSPYAIDVGQSKYYSAKDTIIEGMDQSMYASNQNKPTNVIPTSPYVSSLNIENSERNLNQLDQIMKNLKVIPNFMDDNGNSLSMSKLSRDNLLKSSIVFNIENAKTGRQETDVSNSDDYIDLSLIRQYYQIYLEKVGNSEINYKDLCKNLFEAKESKEIVGAMMHLYTHIFTTIYFSSMIFSANKVKSRSVNHNMSVIPECKKMSLTNEELEYIVEFLISELPNLLAACDDLATCILLEIFEVLGPFNLDYILTQNMFIFKGILQSHKNLYIRRKCIKFLVHCGYLGLELLVSYCDDDINPIGQFILETLVHEPTIQSYILIPSLLNNFHLADIRTRTSSQSCIARFFTRTSLALVKDAYRNLLKESAQEKNLIIGAVRSLGPEGEEELYNLMKLFKCKKIKSCISYYLGFRVQINQEPTIQIKLVRSYSDLKQFPDGTQLCHYVGDQNSPDFSKNLDDWTETEKGELFVNQRNFLLVLKRWLDIKKEAWMKDKNSINIEHFKYELIKPEFPIAFDNFIDMDTLNFDPNLLTIKALILGLKDTDKDVREGSQNSLGVIGLPYIEPALKDIEKLLNDPDSGVRAMAVWCIGKACYINVSMVKIIELLSDSYWKVKTSACVTIGQLGQNAILEALPTLIEHLKSGSINRVIICETIIKLGDEGERMQIEVLKRARVNDAKLILPIIQALELADVESGTIDFVIEELMKFAKADFIPIKKSALEALLKIQERVTESQRITALDAKSLVPFLYKLLSHDKQEIREIAKDFIVLYGAKAELALIEGFTKDQNDSVRCECIKALTLQGIKTIRVVIYGLKDMDTKVRRTTSEMMLKYFKTEDFEVYFKENPSLLRSQLFEINDYVNDDEYNTNNLKRLLFEFKEIGDAILEEFHGGSKK